MANTFSLISCIVVPTSSGTNQISFQNIPSTFNDLVIRWSSSVNSSTSSSLVFNFNNSTATTIQQTLTAQQTTITGARSNALGSIYPNNATAISSDQIATFSHGEMYIFGYNTSSTNKQMFITAGVANQGGAAGTRRLAYHGGVIQLSVPISSILISPNAVSTDFYTNSTFSVYGIKNT